MDDLNNQMSQLTQQQHGLSKIISSLGNFFSGGGSGLMGGYPMSAGGMMTDPQTGYLLDQRTGKSD